jgi:hypothetical protein
MAWWWHAAVLALQELQIAGVNFKAFDLGGHEIARKVWKDYYAKVCSHTSLPLYACYSAITKLYCLSCWKEVEIMARSGR